MLSLFFVLKFIIILLFIIHLSVFIINIYLNVREKAMIIPNWTGVFVLEKRRTRQMGET